MALIFLAIFLILRYGPLMAAVEVPRKLLNDGNRIPILALGTFPMSNEEVRQSINWAVEEGYRHFDTAAMYGNEVGVGLGIRDVIERGLVRREELFVTTKLDSDGHRRNQVVSALNGSLSRLGLKYVDLYLIHSPISKPAGISILETWQGMQHAKYLGLATSIGVSNFNANQLDTIMTPLTETPAVNQIEVHPAVTRESLVSYCHDHNIAVMAYCPLGYLVDRKTSKTPPKTSDHILANMALKYGKNITHIVLRYLIDRDLIPIPKASKKDHIRQNIDVFDFRLTPEEVTTINGFNRNMPIFGWQ